MAEAAWWGLALGVLGAIAGSFLAALVIRWPADRSVATGRSACDTCGVTIRPRDLVPLASAIALRGRCRACGGTIDPTHWRIEAAAAAIGAVTGIVIGTPDAVAGAIFGWLLLALAVLDFRHFWLPDRLTATLALAGVGSGLAGISPGIGERVIGGVAGYLGLAAIAVGYRRLRGHEGMGRGDPKLFGAIGLWVGWPMMPAVLLLASLVGLALAVMLKLRGGVVDRETALPLGTCLAIAAYPAWLAVVAWPR